VGFFDGLVDVTWLAPPRPLAPRPWLGPPGNERPRVLPLDALFVTRRELSIWSGSAMTYREGALLQLDVRWRLPLRVIYPVVPGARGRDGLCVGIETRDGARALAMSQSHGAPRPPSESLALRVVSSRRVLGGATIDLWLWPQPSTPIAVVVEWRSQGVRECRRTVDLDPVSDAQSQRDGLLWSDNSDSARSTVA
jgi:hypothetical protein